MASYHSAQEDTGDFRILSSLRYDRTLLENNTTNAALSGLKGKPCPFYMLLYHRDRLLAAAEHFGWTEVVARLEGDDGLSRFYQDLIREVERTGLDRDPPISLKVYSCSNLMLMSSITEDQQVRALFGRSRELAVEFNQIQPTSINHLFPPSLVHEIQCNGTAHVVGHLSLHRGDGTVKFLDEGEPWCISVDTQCTQVSSFTAFKTTRRDMYNAARLRAGISTFKEPSEVILVNENGEAMEGSFTNIFLHREGRWVTPPLSSGGHDGTVRRWLLEQGLCEEAVIHAKSIVNKEKCFISNGVKGILWGRIQGLSS